MRRQILGTMYNNGFNARESVQHFCKAGVYKFMRAQHVDWGWTRISWSSVTSKKKAYCLNFRGRTYRLANPQIPTFTQPHAASINTGDTKPPLVTRIARTGLGTRLYISVIQGRCLWLELWLTAAKNLIVKAAFELQSLRVFEKRSDSVPVYRK